MSDFLTFLVPGITDGSLYALVALGLVLTYKTSGVFNFAHGGVAAAAAYLFYQFREESAPPSVDLFGLTVNLPNELPWPVAFGLSLVIVAIVGGLLLERIAYWLTGAPTVSVVIATVGLLVLLQSGATAIYTSADLKTGTFLPQDSQAFGRVTVSIADVIIVSTALGTAFALFAFFNRTRTGKAMTAVVDDPNLLSLNGINPAAVRRLAWILGSAFAGMSGMLLAPELGVSVNQLILLVIAGYGAAAVGYFRSLPLTVAGGFAIGILVQESTLILREFDDVRLNSAGINLPFLVLFGVLVFVPVRYLTQQGARNQRRFRPVKDYGPVATGTGLAVLAGLLIALPYILDVFDARTDMNNYIAALGYVIVFASLSLITYQSGQISLCHMGFAAIGAATTGHLLFDGVPFILAVLIGGLVTAPAAAIVAIPAIRLSGIYIAIATFGFAIILQRFFYRADFLFGQTAFLNVPRPSVFGFDMTDDQSTYYLGLGFVFFAFAAILLVRRSRLGSLLRALSDSPDALEAHGANTTVTRVIVFVFSAFLAGIGGAVIASSTGTASATDGGTFDFTNSLVLVAIIGFCGRRPVVAPIIAAALFAVIQIYPPFDSSFFIDWKGVFFGAAAILVAIAPGLGVGRLGTDQRSLDRDGAGLGGQFAQRLEPVRPATAVQPSERPVRAPSRSGSGSSNGARQPAGRGTRVRS